jgi:DNA-binding NarL/FixJ family response regulator
MTRVRIVLADDHALVRTGLRGIVSGFENMEVVGEASDGHQALQLIATLNPDVALVDVTMPRLNGIELAERVAREHPRTRVVILSMHSDTSFVRAALRAGAAGYLLKNADRSELDQALRAVARGETWVSPGVSKAVVEALAVDPAAGPRELLTPRQREILQLVAEGNSTKEIAHGLQLSVKTVETHRSQMMDRLGIRDVAGLIRYAIREGIVGVDP